MSWALYELCADNPFPQGTSGVGKTTLLRQLQILYGEGFSDEERENFKPKIISATFRAFEEGSIVWLKVPRSLEMARFKDFIE